MKRRNPGKRMERELYVTPDEWKLIVSTAYSLNVKMGLLWDFIGHSGFRISEALAVTVKDLDFDRSDVRVITMKQRQKAETKEADIIKISPTLMTIIKKYIDDHKMEQDDRIWEFSRQYAYNYFRWLLRKKLNIQLRKSPHGLRHCHGIMIAEITGGDAIKISKRLRQKTLIMASRYTHLTDQINEEVVKGIEEKFTKQEKKQ